MGISEPAGIEKQFNKVIITINNVKYNTIIELLNDFIEVIIENTITKHIYSNKFSSSDISLITTKVGMEMKAEDFYNIICDAINNTTDDNKDIYHNGSEEIDSKRFDLNIIWKLNGPRNSKIEKKFTLILEENIQEPHIIMGKIMSDFVSQKAEIDSISSISNRLDKIDSELKDIKSELSKHDVDKEDIDHNISELTDRLDEHDEQILELKESYDERISDLNSRLDEYDSINVIQRNISDLTNRLDKSYDGIAIDSKINNVNKRIDNTIFILEGVYQKKDVDKQFKDIQDLFDKKLCHLKSELQSEYDNKLKEMKLEMNRYVPKSYHQRSDIRNEQSLYLHTNGVLSNRRSPSPK